MTALPLNVFRFAGQTMEAPGAINGLQAGDAFGRAREKAALGGDTSPEIVADGVQNMVAKDGLTAMLFKSPVNSIFEPKLESIGQSLAVLQQHVGGLPSAQGGGLVNRLTRLETDFKSVGNNVEQTSMNGNPMDMLKLQNDIYQIDEELELLSKVVEQMTSGIKTVLQMQV